MPTEWIAIAAFVLGTLAFGLYLRGTTTDAADLFWPAARFRRGRRLREQATFLGVDLGAESRRILADRFDGEASPFDEGSFERRGLSVITHVREVALVPAADAPEDGWWPRPRPVWRCGVFRSLP